MLFRLACGRGKMAKFFKSHFYEGEQPPRRFMIYFPDAEHNEPKGEYKMYSFVAQQHTKLVRMINIKFFWNKKRKEKTVIADGIAELKNDENTNDAQTQNILSLPKSKDQQFQSQRIKPIWIGKLRLFPAEYFRRSSDNPILRNHSGKG